jgi:hypothetical protein
MWVVIVWTSLHEDLKQYEFIRWENRETKWPTPCSHHADITAFASPLLRNV